MLSCALLPAHKWPGSAMNAFVQEPISLTRAGFDSCDRVGAACSKAALLSLHVLIEGLSNRVAQPPVLG